MLEKSEEVSESTIIEVYEKLYDQFVDIKRLTFSMAETHRTPDALATLISKEIEKMDGAQDNSVWLISDNDIVVEAARKGKTVPVHERRTFSWDSSDEFQRLIVNQKVAWGPFDGGLKDLFPDFKAPIAFPLKGVGRAIGFLVLDHDRIFDIELCQHIIGFSSLILQMSSLYFQLKEEISERQSLQTLLIKEKDRAQKYLDIAEVMLLALNTSGTVELINRKGCKILGYTAEEIVGKNWFEHFTFADDRELLQSTFAGIMTDESKSSKHVETRTITRDGTVRLIAWSNTRVANDEGKIVGTFSCGEDITEKKQIEIEKQKLQDNLIQAQKAQALGTLVGGIAHDFNNMLQAIIGYSELVLDDQQVGKESQRFLQNVLKTGHEAAELVEKLLAFGQQSRVITTTFDLNDQLRQLSPMISRTLPNIVQLDLNLSHSPAMINGDKGQLDQIVMNLAINASEAMPNGGSLAISTSIVFLDAVYCKSHLEATPGDHVMLSVKDTGKGMDQHTLEQIFDPFFSTKERGATRGTGLGLSVVRGIVQQRGGHITCESQPGKGAEFKAYFPLIETPEPEESSIAIPVVSMATQTILVVEDNANVANLEQRVLKKDGYNVIVAVNGREAVEIFQNKKDQISLVLLDLIMPKMSGRDCLMELVKINPSVKVLVASGYTPEDSFHDEIRPFVKGFVRKPFSNAELLEEVQKTLVGHGG